MIILCGSWPWIASGFHKIGALFRRRDRPRNSLGHASTGQGISRHFCLAWGKIWSVCRKIQSGLATCITNNLKGNMVAERYEM